MIDFSQLRTLSEQSNRYTPSKVFDTRPSYDGVNGDVCLKKPTEGLFDTHNTELASLRHSLQEMTELQPHDPESRAMTRYAQRRLSEIALSAAAVEQITGNKDKSSEIAEIEANLYPYFRPSLYRAALQQKIDGLDRVTCGPAKEVAKSTLLDELEAMVERNPSGEIERIVRPNTRTIEQVQAWIYDQFEDVFAYIDDLNKPVLDSDDIKNVFDVCINTTPAMHETGWSTQLVDREKLAISVSADQRMIIIPKKRTMPAAQMKRVAVHEGFGHALRAAYAELAGDVVGSLGTASYARFEESFMIALEQCFNGKYDPNRGIDNYIAVGMSVEDHLSIDDVGRIFCSIQMIKDDTDLSDERVGLAHTSAANQLKRTFAGMTDVDPGIAHRKDIDYLTGLNDSWALLDYSVEYGCLGSTMRWLLSAKFNPFEPDDRELVEGYSPMPAELRAFFSTHA